MLSGASASRRIGELGPQQIAVLPPNGHLTRGEVRRVRVESGREWASPDGL